MEGRQGISKFLNCDGGISPDTATIEHTTEILKNALGKQLSLNVLRVCEENCVLS